MEFERTFCFDADLQTTFRAPAGNDPIALNLQSMGQGEAWVNGQSIGRYWVSFKTSKGNPSQTRYAVNTVTSIHFCAVT